MKIAIASSGKKESSTVSPIVGRAPYYLIYDNDDFVEVIKNPFAVGGGGAGLGVAQMLHDKDIKMIVGGKFGPNVIEAIKEKDMVHKEIGEIDILEALKKVLS